ncbi:glycosyltransferase [Cerasicoccus maritimus]|uniref:glycosyltransferase n=1 Tax=Cerasicoccus maritimus TaxID=490089 RepID=UPI0028529762|nr:glycosyltransferase [Cerasicoccus maritimus]
MKIVFINHTRSGGGGATIAAERLVEGLKEAGHHVNWLVKDLHNNDAPNDYDVIPQGAIDRILEWPLKQFLTLGAGRRQTFALLKHPFVEQADLIHLHNLHPSYFNFLALPRLSRNKPIVWTLHDMWALTGHCAFSQDCERWQVGCGQCPYLGVYPGLRHDGTALEWRLKRWALKRTHAHLLTPSRWLADCASTSIASSLPQAVIPYGLNTQRYTPGDRRHAQSKLGLKGDRITLLLTSANLDDPRKPQGILCEALNMLANSHPNTFQVLTFGGGDLRKKLNPHITITALGRLTDDTAKVQAYQAADVLLFASRGDNLPLTIQEALACGTPVIANRVGGAVEMVIPGQTGLLTEQLSPESFQLAIASFLKLPTNKRNTLALQAREFAVANFDLARHVEHTLAQYTKAINDFTAN